MIITNKTLGRFIVFGIPLIAFFYIGLFYSFNPMVLKSFGFTGKSVFMIIMYGIYTLFFAGALFWVLMGLFDDSIKFEFEIPNPFKKGRYLSPEEEKHFQEYLKERENEA